MSVLNDLGTCCACEGSTEVKWIIPLPHKAPNPRYGWDCAVCHVKGGAVAVICSSCLALNTQVKFVVDDYPYKNIRIPIEAVNADLYLHDYAYHPERWLFQSSPNLGDPECICSVCREVINENDKHLRLMRPNGEARFHDPCFERASKLARLPNGFEAHGYSKN